MICEIKINGEDSRLYQQISDRLSEKDAMLEYSSIKSMKSLYRENEQGEPRLDDVQRNWMGNKELDSLLSNFLQDVGVSVKAVNSIKDNNGDIIPATGRADITRRTIDYIQGKESVLLEEASHFMIESLDKESNLYKSMYDMIDRYDEYQEVKDSKLYKSYYKNSEDMIRREAMGKVLANRIADRFEGNVIKQRQVDSWIKRIINQLKKLFTFDTNRFHGLSVQFDEVINQVINRKLDRVKGDGIFYDIDSPIDRIFTEDIEEVKEDYILQTHPNSSRYFTKIPGGYRVEDVNGEKWIIDMSEEKIADAKRRIIDSMKSSSKDYKGRLISDLSSDEPSFIATPMHNILTYGLTKPEDGGKYMSLNDIPHPYDFLKDENIIIHKDSINGKDRYTIIIGTYKRSDPTDKTITIGNLTPSRAKRLGLTVLDNMEGKAQMLGSLVAMHIKSTNPEAIVGDIRFSSGGKRGIAKHLNIKEGVENWRILNEQGYDLIDLNEEYLEHVLYEQNYIDLIFKYYDENKSDKKFPAPFEVDDPPHIKLEKINRKINKLHKIYGDSGLKNHGIKKEFRLLTEAKIQLEEQVRGYKSQPRSTDLDHLEVWLKNQLEQPNQYVNLIMGTIRKWFYSIKANYKKYNSNKNKVFEKYFEAWGNDSSNRTESAKIKEILFTNQEEVYKDLFIYEELEVYDSEGKPVKENGKTKTKKVNTFRFKEDSELKDYQKEFVNYVIEQQRKSIIELAKTKIQEGLFDDNYTNAEEWYNEVVGYNDRLLNLLSTDLTDSLLKGNIKQGLKNWWEQHMDYQDLDFGNDPRKYTKNDLGRVNSLIGDKYGSRGRRMRLGITYIGSKAVYTGNKGLSEDVQVMLDTFVYGNMKQQRMGEFRSVFLSGKLALQREGMLKNKEMTKELSTVEKLYDYLVYREMEHLNVGGADATKALNNLRKATSGVILAGNFASGLITLIGSNTTLITNTASGMFGKAFFGIKNLYNAAKYIGKNFDKANQITELMGLHNSNESTLMYADRFKAGKREMYKGLLNGRFNMVFTGMGDYIAKMLITIGQLDKDGILHNFKLDKEGEVYYDWSMDKRDKLIKDKIQENLERMSMPKGEKGFLIPYDNSMLDSLQTISSQTLGSMNDEQRSRLNTNAWAATIFQFRSYLLSRANQVWSRGYYNENIRTYSVKNGKLQVDMLYQQGFLNSLATTSAVLRENGYNVAKSWNELNDTQRANFRRFAISIVTYAAAYLVYMDDDESDNPYRRYLGYALTDLIGVYHAGEYLNGFASPPSVSLLLKTSNALGNAMVFDFEKAGAQFVNLFGISRNIKYAYETFQ